MEIQTVRLGGVVKVEHRVLVRYEAAVRLPDGFPKVLLFYRKTAEAVIRWSEEILGARAKKEYGALHDFWAQARFLPYRFFLQGEPVYEDETYFAIVCNSVFTQGNERQVRRCAQVWNKREQTILPPALVWRFFGKGKPPRQKGFRADGCYPTPGEMVFFQNPDSKTPFIERKIKIFEG